MFFPLVKYDARQILHRVKQGSALNRSSENILFLSKSGKLGGKVQKYYGSCTHFFPLTAKSLNYNYFCEDKHEEENGQKNLHFYELLSRSPRSNLLANRENGLVCEFKCERDPPDDATRTEIWTWSAEKISA